MEKQHYYKGRFDMRSWLKSWDYLIEPKENELNLRQTECAVEALKTNAHAYERYKRGRRRPFLDIKKDKTLT